MEHYSAHTSGIARSRIEGVNACGSRCPGEVKWLGGVGFNDLVVPLHDDLGRARIGIDRNEMTDVGGENGSVDKWFTTVTRHIEHLWRWGRSRGWSWGWGSRINHMKVNHDWVSSDARSAEAHVGGRCDYMIPDRRKPSIVNVARTVTGNRERFVLVDIIQRAIEIPFHAQDASSSDLSSYRLIAGSIKGITVKQGSRLKHHHPAAIINLFTNDKSYRWRRHWSRRRSW